MIESEKRRLCYELAESELLGELSRELLLELFGKWATCDDSEELARIHASAKAVEQMAQAMVRKANEYRHERSEPDDPAASTA